MLRGFDDYELTAGDVIRGARATMGMDIAAVAERLRISPEPLLEIEEGVYSGAQPHYLMNNIVRDYARFLDLDPNEIRALYWKDVEQRSSQAVAAVSAGPLLKEQETSLFQRVMARLGLWQDR